MCLVTLHMLSLVCIA
ncbi:unnamed protein product [Staurois parvus]|uniref:Uncharacterized protein n=1 Tax=Staurois parvus TaxID=386267 RepID=A0ABN9GBT2_9NEOB|nr:unnamed protein product [Staurois parvus]